MAKTAKKKAAKKSARKAAPPKTLLVPQPARVGFHSKAKGIQVQYSDGTEHYFALDQLHSELYKNFIAEMVTLDKGKVIIPYRGDAIELSAKQLEAIRNPMRQDSSGEVFIKLNAFRFDRIMNIYRIFGKWIAHKAKRANKSQADLAKECGINTATMTHYFAGKLKPELHNFLKLCRALKVNIDKP